jgi:hypothetical protein
MTTTYTLTRVFDGDDSPYASTSFTTSDADHINAAHMLAAGFNTMSRNFTIGHVLAVVDTQNGLVHYDGKVEQIDRGESWSVSKTFNFEASTDHDGVAMSVLFDDERGKLMFPSNLKLRSDYAHVARSVLEDAYADYMGIRERLYEAGVETIPVSAGVDELHEQIAELTKRNDHEFHARSMYEQVEGQKRESARAEMISFVKRAHAKKVELQTAVPDGEGRSEVESRWRGMLDVLAKFLVVTGEADTDEGHAVARRLCGIDEEMS